MNWIDYREALGIGFSDRDKFLALRRKVISLFVYLDKAVEYDGYKAFSFFEYFIKICVVPSSQDILGVIESMKQATSMEDLISKYVAFANMADNYFVFSWTVKLIQNFLPDQLSELKIPYQIIRDDDGVFVFPKGAKEFDDALVSQPLEWLKDYPDAENAWSKALREYAEAIDDNASDVADKFRKALEAFFQEFFGGSKSLENYKAEYGGYLKQRNIPKEISGNFETVLQAYTNYMNNYAKHRDGTSDTVLEYIMYQTGNIIRLLITLKQEESTNAN